MKTILVTGGSGFIGSHTSVELLKEGFRIIVLDSLVNSSSNVIKKIKKINSLYASNSKSKLSFVCGDIRDLDLLDRVFHDALENKNRIDAVIHFAGLKSVYHSIQNPLEYWDVNFGGTVNLLKIINKYDCSVIIFSSSATIYSPESISPIKEEDLIDPISPYGKTKEAVERLLDDFYYANKDRISIANLRYFNPIGAHPSGLIGEETIGTPTNIFPIINKVACGEIEQLKIFGNDWNTLDGTGVRDFVHVVDIAQGHVKVLKYLKNRNSQILKLNLATGKGTSVLQLINTFEKVNKVKIPFTFDKRRDGDRDIVFADNSLALKILKWKPQKTIEEMCEDGWRWKCLEFNKFN